MNKIFKVSIDIVLTKDIKWRAWKGSFGGKLIYDSFKTMNIEPTFSFRVTPPRKFKPSMKSGDSVLFEAVFWGNGSEEAVGTLIEALASLPYAFPKKVEASEIDIEKPEVGGGDDPLAVLFTVNHDPTYYRYHGAWVPLPAARRLVFSLFKRIWEASGYELEEVKELANAIEVIGGKPTFSRYKLGLGEEIPAFHGRVKYYGVMSERLARLLKWGLKYLPLLGNGSSPGMGFGNVTEVTLSSPPFETPVEPWHVNEKYTL